jgi:Phosphatidylinositol-4-phosphate 5-Kinase
LYCSFRFHLQLPNSTQLITNSNPFNGNTQGVKGIVLPVVDEQWSSVIAYSLASTEYAKQFKHFSKFHVSNMSADPMLMSPTSIGSVDGSSLESTIFDPTSGQDWNESRTTERRMLFRNKTHIKHTFRDFDEKGHVTCKFVCTTYWATQFHAVRQIFLSNNSTGTSEDADLLSSPGAVEQSYIESLSSAYSWAASGGKSGASFSRTSDDRFIVKSISRLELQMFLDCAPAYFEYLSKAFFHGLPTVLCKIVGVYQIGVHNRETVSNARQAIVGIRESIKHYASSFSRHGPLVSTNIGKEKYGASGCDAKYFLQQKDYQNF